MVEPGENVGNERWKNMDQRWQKLFMQCQKLFRQGAQIFVQIQKYNTNIQTDGGIQRDDDEKHEQDKIIY